VTLNADYGPRWYGLDHQVISLDDAERLLTDVDARRVAVTRVGRYKVSTVFLVLDHDLLGIGPPVLYETMIFGGKKEPQWRYCTREAALAGHDRVVSDLRAQRRE
jgi:hypothetical protein